MSSKILTPSDYRFNILGADIYGRRECDRCGKRRLINAYWQDTNKVLCTACSRVGTNALKYSLR